MKGFIFAITVGLFVAMGVSAFWDMPKDANTVDKETQEDIMKRAQTAEPVYQIQNFLSRQAINEWAERMDEPDKLWYVYLMTDSGAFIGYHICRTVPLSYGVSMTNPERREHGGNGAVSLPAPGVDGVYYAGTDAEVFYCFDAETDALVTFKTNFVHYDQPLDMNVPELKLNVE